MENTATLRKVGRKWVVSYLNDDGSLKADITYTTKANAVRNARAYGYSILTAVWS